MEEFKLEKGMTMDSEETLHYPRSGEPYYFEDPLQTDSLADYKARSLAWDALSQNQQQAGAIESLAAHDTVQDSEIDSLSSVVAELSSGNVDNVARSMASDAQSNASNALSLASDAQQSASIASDAASSAGSQAIAAQSTASEALSEVTDLSSSVSTNSIAISSLAVQEANDSTAISGAQSSVASMSITVSSLSSGFGSLSGVVSVAVSSASSEHSHLQSEIDSLSLEGANHLSYNSSYVAQGLNLPQNEPIGENDIRYANFITNAPTSVVSSADVVVLVHASGSGSAVAVVGDGRAALVGGVAHEIEGSVTSGKRAHVTVSPDSAMMALTSAVDGVSDGMVTNILNMASGKTDMYGHDSLVVRAGNTKSYGEIPPTSYQPQVSLNASNGAITDTVGSNGLRVTASSGVQYTEDSGVTWQGFATDMSLTSVANSLATVDSALRDSISAEQSMRAVQDASLTTALGNEASTRSSQVSSLAAEIGGGLEFDPSYASSGSYVVTDGVNSANILISPDKSKSVRADNSGVNLVGNNIGIYASNQVYTRVPTSGGSNVLQMTSSATKQNYTMGGSTASATVGLYNGSTLSVAVGVAGGTYRAGAAFMGSSATISAYDSSVYTYTTVRPNSFQVTVGPYYDNNPYTSIQLQKDSFIVGLNSGATSSSAGATTAKMTMNSTGQISMSTASGVTEMAGSNGLRVTSSSGIQQTSNGGTTWTAIGGGGAQVVNHTEPDGTEGSAVSENGSYANMLVDERMLEANSYAYATAQGMYLYQASGESASAAAYTALTTVGPGGYQYGRIEHSATSHVVQNAGSFGFMVDINGVYVTSDGWTTSSAIYGG